MGASLCSVLMPPSVASGHSKSNEDLKQQNSELEEKLRLLVIEKSAMQLGVEELGQLPPAEGRQLRKSFRRGEGRSGPQR